MKISSIGQSAPTHPHALGSASGESVKSMKSMVFHLHTEKNIFMDQEARTRGKCTEGDSFSSTSPISSIGLKSADRGAWHELHTEYMAHHWTCSNCQAAGRGSQYGLRCGTGTALWGRYTLAAGAQKARR